MWLVTRSYPVENQNAFENAFYLGSRLLDAITAKWSMDEKDPFFQG